jgi:hypothetical protein
MEIGMMIGLFVGNAGLRYYNTGKVLESLAVGLLAAGIYGLIMLAVRRLRSE